MTREEELNDLINEWLDARMAVYGEILEEWETHTVVQGHPTAPTHFSCVHCGRCCHFRNHWVWVYPSDIVRWLSELDTNPHIKLLLCILFPVQDMDDITGYGLPSQQLLAEKFTELSRRVDIDKRAARILLLILTQIKHMNPSFDATSDACIFYDTGSAQNAGRCLIYTQRPVQCRTYPMDYPHFTRIVLPPQLAEKYGVYPDNLEDLPDCPPSAFHGGTLQQGVSTTEADLEEVTQEKANYLATFITREWDNPEEFDISDLFLEYLQEDFLTHTTAETGSSPRNPPQSGSRRYTGRPSPPPATSSPSSPGNSGYIPGKRPSPKKTRKSPR